MNILQAFKMAFRSIWGKKGRSALTMLGIVIGIAAVMTIVSILQGLTKKSMEMFEAMGNNKISVSAYANNGMNIFDDIYDACLQMDDLVEGVTPKANIWGVVTYGTKNSENMDGEPSLYLGSEQYSLCNNFQIARGRDLSKMDVDNYNNVCVLGYQASMNFFDLADPIGRNIQVNGVPFTVIGVYAKKDDFNEPRWSMDNMILFPYTASRSLGTTDLGNEFVVKAKNAEATEMAVIKLKSFFTNLLGDQESGKETKGWFSVWSEDSWQEQSQDMAKMFSLVLGGIAGISLLVGGIGIMNIMLVTVTERTREIGVRRAIGAKKASILTQFLIESGMICAIGGAFGVLIGTGLTVLGSTLLLKEQIYPAWDITLGAVLFSSLLGMIFGLYPALKASSLPPVEALRAE